MKLKALTLPLACLALALTVPGDSISYAGHSSKLYQKEFSTVIDMNLTEAHVVVNGKEQDTSMVAMEMNVVNTSDFSWEDSISSVDPKNGALPTRFTRRFTKLTTSTTTSQSNNMTGARDMKVENSSDLLGESVEFSRLPTEKAFTSSFKPQPNTEAPDPALLKGLAENTDLRSFLPTGEVQIGDKWEVDSAALQHLLSPGGNLEMKPTDPELAAIDGNVSFYDLFNDIKGSLTCEYLGRKTVDKHPMAIIGIQMEINSDRNLMEFLSSTPENTYEWATANIVIKGSGELLWDLKGQHFSNLNMKADLKQFMETTVQVKTAAETYSFEQQLTMAGTIKLAFKCSTAE